MPMYTSTSDRASAHENPDYQEELAWVTTPSDDAALAALHGDAGVEG